MRVAGPAALTGDVARSPWQILAGGTFALWSYSLLYVGIAVIAPTIRTTFHVGLAATGAALGAVSAGAAVTLFLWGVLADRIGDRVVMSSGLLAGAIALVPAALAGSFGVFVALLFVAGSLGASVNAPSARSVMAWFGPERRGMALGIRQTAVPLGGLCAALVMPLLSLTGAVLVTSLAMLLGGLVAVLTVRDRTHARSAGVENLPRPWRDRRVLGSASVSILLSTAQLSVVGFSVLFLHEARGVAISAAALLFAGVQVLAAGARVAVGWWSDRLGSRLRPIRWLTVALTCAVAATSILVTAPLVLLLPAMLVAGGLSMAWNALVLTATAEFAGPRRSGAALGLQQTGLSLWSTIVPPVFAALVVSTSWRFSFGAVALVVASAYPLLVRLDRCPALA